MNLFQITELAGWFLIAFFVLGKYRHWLGLRTRKTAIRNCIKTWNGGMYLAGVALTGLHAFPVGLIQQGVSLAIAGATMVAVGTILNMWAHRALGRCWHMHAVVYVDHEVIDHGPYAFISHPIYFSEFLILFGSWLHLPTWFGLPVLAWFVWDCARRARIEEKLLTEHLPGYETRKPGTRGVFRLHSQHA